MNDNERRAIVWDKIERLAFRPDSPRQWLSVYARTLHILWGIEPRWDRLAPHDQFCIPFFRLKCAFKVESTTKFSASILQDTSAAHCYWQNHTDSAYLSRGALNIATAEYPHQQKSQLREDIEAVLDGMIFHPRCHTHLEDLGIRHVQLSMENGGLESHEIRIGGGIENPYVFLFNVRYQFCLVHEDVRRDERARLIDLFNGAIRTDERIVNARDLFNFKK